MKIRTVIGAAFAAIAIATTTPASAHDIGDKVTPNFEQAIPNIPGKSLTAVVVDYPPGAASVPHIHAKSAFVYAYVISGRIEFEGERRRDARLQGGRELVRATRLQPSRQPQREQDQAGKAARGLRRRYRRQGS